MARRPAEPHPPARTSPSHAHASAAPADPPSPGAAFRQAAPRTSSEALNNATLPFGLALADKGLDALKADPHLARGLNVLKGEITYPAVAQALGLEWSDPFGVWARG